MAPENPKMPRDIDDPLLCGHTCELTCIGRVLFEVHGEIGGQAVKRREVLDGMEEIRLCSAGALGSARVTSGPTYSMATAYLNLPFSIALSTKRWNG